jgi:hypothetical protein
MDEPITKDKLLDELRSARVQWERLISELDKHTMTQAGAVGDWSVKDVIAHCSSYAQWHVNALQAHLRGEPPSLEGTAYATEYKSIDERNQLDFERNQHRPLGDVLAEFRQVFQQLIESVEVEPETFLVEPQTFEGVPEPVLMWKQLEHVCDHYSDHLLSIRAWVI